MTEDDAPGEPIDRRAEVRTPFRNMRVRILTGPAKESSHYVLDASRTGFFVRMLQHDEIAVGATMEFLLTFDKYEVRLTGSVVRKETQPRPGFAVHISSILADDKLTYRRIVLGLV